MPLFSDDREEAPRLGFFSPMPNKSKLRLLDQAIAEKSAIPAEEIKISSDRRLEILDQIIAKREAEVVETPKVSSGLFRKGVSAIGGGMLGAGEMYGRAIRGLPGGEEAGIGEEGVSGAILGITRRIEKRLPILKEPEDIGAIYQGIRSAVTSLTARAPHMAVGAAIGAAIGGPAAPLTTFIGALGGYIFGGATLFGLAEYDSFIENAVQSKRYKQGKITKDQIESGAISSGLHEAGWEFASDILTGAITLGMGAPIAKAGITTLKEWAKTLFKTSGKEMAKRATAIIAGEVSTEMATAGFQTEEMYKLGLTDARFMDGMKQAFGPAFVASLIFAGFFEGGVRLNRRKVKNALENTNVNPEARIGVVNYVQGEMAKINPELADTWGDLAMQAVENRESISMDEKMIDETANIHIEKTFVPEQEAEIREPEIETTLAEKRQAEIDRVSAEEEEAYRKTPEGRQELIEAEMPTPMTTISEETTNLARPIPAPLRAFGMREKALTPEARQGIIEAEMPVPTEPTVEIGIEKLPEFSGSTEALTFGKDATLDQIKALKQRREVSLGKFEKLIATRNLEKASIEVTKAQLDKEAIDALEILREHPEYLKKPAKEVAAEEAGKLPWEGKQDWEMTKSEIAEKYAFTGTVCYHEDAIRQAQKEGEEIPERVLAEYPGLKPAKEVAAEKVEKAEVEEILTVKEGMEDLYSWYVTARQRGGKLSQKEIEDTDVFKSGKRNINEIIAYLENKGVEVVAKPPTPKPAKPTKPEAVREEIEGKVIPKPASEKFVWMRNKEAGQKTGNLQENIPITENIFNEHVQPRLREGLSFDEWKNENPVDTHIQRIVSEDGIEMFNKTGSLKELRPKGKQLEWTKEVDSFTSKEAVAWRKIADSEAKPKPEKEKVEVTPEKKEPWKITRDEYVKQYIEEQRAADFPEHMITDKYKESIMRDHFAAVSEAFAENKTIPPEVLKDYPDLKLEQKVEVETTPEGKEISVDLTKKEEAAVTPKQQKEYLLAEIDKAIEEAPEVEVETFTPPGRYPEYGSKEAKAEWQKEKRVFLEQIEERNKRYGMVTIHVPDDGVFTIVNAKQTLTEFKKKAKKFPSTFPKAKITVPGVIRKTPLKEDIGEIKTVRGGKYFSDGSLIIKGKPPAKAMYVEKAVPQERMKELLATKTEPAELKYYAFDDPDIGQGVGTTPIPSALIGEYWKPMVVFQAKDGTLYNYGQLKFNAIVKRFPKTKYGIGKEEQGILIAYEGKEPIAALMPVRIRTGEEGAVMEDMAIKQGFIKTKEAKPEPTELGFGMSQKDFANEARLKAKIQEFVDYRSKLHNEIGDELKKAKKFDELRENSKKASAISKMDKITGFKYAPMIEKLNALPKWLRDEFETYNKGKLEKPTGVKEDALMQEEHPEEYVPITRKEADALFDKGAAILVARFNIHGPETTGEEGYYMRLPVPGKVVSYDEKEIKSLYEKYKERHGGTESGVSITSGKTEQRDGRLPAEVRDEKAFATKATKPQDTITRADLKSIFAKMKNISTGVDKDGNFFFRLLGKPVVTIYEVNEIEGYIDTSKGRIPVGSFLGNTIELKTGGEGHTADIGTAWHEFFHGLKRMGVISDNDNKALNRAISQLKGIDEESVTEEDQAYYVGDTLFDWHKQKNLRIKRVLKKIADFVNAVWEFVAQTKVGQRVGMEPRTARGVLVDIETGAILSEKELSAVNQFAQDVSFSLKKAAKAITDNPNFVKWFGKSQARNRRQDEILQEHYTGNPLVVYHGTRARKPISVFSQSKGISNWGKSQKAFFFSDNPKMSPEAGAKYVGMIDEKGEPTKKTFKEGAKFGMSDVGGSYYPVYLKIENPMPIPFGYSEWVGDIKMENELIAMAKKGGYDGLIGSVREAYKGWEHVYVVFEPTQIKSIYNTGAFGITEKDIMFQMAGEKAIGAPTGQLVKAQEMLAEGKDKKEVWRETGWMVGVEGKWKWEIDDSKSSLNMLNIPNGKSTIELSKILNHPRLYAAYPELKGKEVVLDVGNDVMSKGKLIGGKDNFISISGPRETIKDILLHEIQHAIQEVEGFARGGSPEQFVTKTGVLKPATRGQVAIFFGLEPSGKVYLKEGGAITKDKLRLVGQDEQLFFKEAPGSQYQRLASEIEAREVEIRKNLTKEQRRIMPPYADEAIPEDQWIITDGEGTSFSVSPKREGLFKQKGSSLDNEGMELNYTVHIDKHYGYDKNGKYKLIPDKIYYDDVGLNLRSDSLGGLKDEITKAKSIKETKQFATKPKVKKLTVAEKMLGLKKIAKKIKASSDINIAPSVDAKEGAKNWKDLYETKAYPKLRKGLDSVVKAVSQAMPEKVRRGLSEKGVSVDVKQAARMASRKINELTQEGIKHVENIKNNVPESEYKLLYQVLDGRAKSGKLTAVSEPIRKNIVAWGKRLVDAKVLDPQTYKRGLGTYLHRTIAKYETQNPLKAFMYRKFKLYEKQFKHRGVPPKQVANKNVNAWLAGEKDGSTWEILKVGKENTTIWRDWTETERESHGEIMDAVHAVARTFEAMAKSVGYGEFFSELSENSNITKSEWEPGMVQVPGTRITKGGTYKFGKLQGKYVSKDDYDYIMSIAKASDTVFWKPLVTFFKKNKTYRNPGTHLNNFLQNIMWSDFKDVPWKTIVQATKEYKTSGKWFKEAEALDVFGHDIITQELRDSTSMPTETETKGGMKGLVDRMVTHMGRADEKAMSLYQAEDGIFRLAYYIDRVQKGSPKDIAADGAIESFIDYEINAPWIKKLRDTGVVPFISWPYKALPLMIDNIMRKPWKLAKWATIFYAANLVAQAVAGGDEEKERELLPEHMKGWSPFGPTALKVPFRSAGDLSIYADISRKIPFGDVFNFTSTQVGPFGFGGPVFMPFEIWLNKQAYSDREIVTKRVDSVAEQIGKYAKFVWRGIMPNIPGLPYSYATSNIMAAATSREDWLGRDQSVLAATVGGFGLKGTAINIEKRLYWKQKEFDRDIRKLKGKITSAKFSPTASPASIAKAEDKYNRRVIERTIDWIAFLQDISARQPISAVPEKIKTNIVDIELGKLEQPSEAEIRKGTKPFAINPPARYLIIKNKKIELTQTQYDKYVEDSGNSARTRLERLMEGAWWKKATRMQKENNVQKIVKESRANIRDKLKRELGKQPIPGMVPWKTKKKPAWQKSMFGKKSAWQKSRFTEKRF